MDNRSSEPQAASAGPASKYVKTLLVERSRMQILRFSEMGTSNARPTSYSAAARTSWASNAACRSMHAETPSAGRTGAMKEPYLPSLYLGCGINRPGSEEASRVAISVHAKKEAT